MRKGKNRSSERVGKALERYINYKQPKINALEVAPIKRKLYIILLRSETSNRTGGQVTRRPPKATPAASCGLSVTCQEVIPPRQPTRPKSLQHKHFARVFLCGYTLYKKENRISE